MTGGLGAQFVRHRLPSFYLDDHESTGARDHLTTQAESPTKYDRQPKQAIRCVCHRFEANMQLIQW